MDLNRLAAFLPRFVPLLEDMAADVRPESLRVQLSVMADADQRDLLPRITVPTLLTVFTIGEMLSLPVGAAYIAELAPVELRGRYMGANGLTWALALIVGPSAGTALFTWEPNALWIASAICGVVAAVVLLRGGNGLVVKP